MPSLRPRLAPLLALLALAACGGSSTPPPLPDLPGRLAALPGVASVEERATGIPGTRFFLLGFDQPVDHEAASGPRFTQRATLLFRSEGAPTVLATTGYGIGLSPGQAEPTALLQANQVLLEHRYFAPSAPAVLDWPRLDIRQAAHDQHRVTAALRQLLTGRWLNTGGSKGGMTAVYHRFFFPADVDATLAYVAPLSFSASDPRYVGYLEAIGPPACRDALHAAQRALLAARAQITARMAAAAAARGDGYASLGLEAAFEFAVVELPFGFWQYGGESLCAGVPAAGASADQLFDWMEQVFGRTTDWYGDAALAYYAPYYWQSATQLGGPAYPQAHLLDLLPGGLPVNDVPALYPPPGVAKPWDARAMPEVDAWVTAHGERMMFVYGERDPWSGGQFTPTRALDAMTYVVPLANHGARLAGLPPAERAEAEATLRRWMNAAAPSARRAPGEAAPEATVDERLLLPRWPRGR